MIPSIQSKFFTRLLSGLALIGVFLILPHNAKADAIAATGQCINPNTRNGFGCVDPNYQPAISLGTNIFLQKTDLSGTSPGFLAAPAGPSGAFWIAQLSDVQFGEAVNDWRVTFSTPAGTGNITVSGTMAAEGSVAVALNGVGVFAGPQSLTSLGNFSVTASSGTTNNLDFIFTGCLSFPSCSANGEPVAGLLVDPSWSIAAPGTPLDTIPESVLFADKGFAPSSTPEPPALILLGSGLLSLAIFLRRR